MSETGIPNCGNTCFMNASFQMLYSMEEFRDKIMNTDWDKYLEEDDERLKKIKALKKIFELMDNKPKWGNVEGNNTLDDYDPDKPRFNLIEAKTELIKLIVGVRGEAEITLGSQQDASNFILKLLETIYDVEESIYEIGLLSKFYRGGVIDYTYCKNLSTFEDEDIGVVVDEINLISLPINNKKNITESLKEMVQEEQIYSDKEGVNNIQTCIDLSKKTGNKYNSYKKKSITFPEENKYIIISLNRFEYDNIKNVFYRVVDASFNVEHKVVIDGKNFSLIGAVLHSGLTTNSGHYIYQTYDNDGNVLKTYNDVRMGNGEVFDIYYGKKMTLKLNSYVLLYKRLDGEAPAAAEAPPQSPEEEEEAASPPEASTAAAASSTSSSTAAASSTAAVASSTAAAASATEAPIDQQKGKGEILQVVLKFDNGDEIYEGFELGKREWVPKHESHGGNKKSRKPKSKKIRLRKTRRRKH